MPDASSRKHLVASLMRKHGAPISDRDLDQIGKLTDGYTCSDITNLARDAAMEPLRELTTADLVNIQSNDMRQICLQVLKSKEYTIVLVIQ